MCDFSLGGLGVCLRGYGRSPILLSHNTIYKTQSMTTGCLQKKFVTLFAICFAMFAMLLYTDINVPLAQQKPDNYCCIMIIMLNKETFPLYQQTVKTSVYCIP